MQSAFYFRIYFYQFKHHLQLCYLFSKKKKLTLKEYGNGFTAINILIRPSK